MKIKDLLKLTQGLVEQGHGAAALAKVVRDPSTLPIELEY